MKNKKHLRDHRVLLHGLPYFCRQFPAIVESEGWNVQHYPTHGVFSTLKLLQELRRTDLLYVWGARISMGKVLRAARTLGQEKIVMFWCGSDTLFAQKEFAAGKLDPWVAGRIHWAGAPWLAEEIRALGIPCEYVPVTWVPPVTNLEELPEKFSILTYVPSVQRGGLYGLDRILKAARRLPHISFELMGLQHGEIPDPPKNLAIFDRTVDMASYYRRATVYWRPVAHDGLAFMCLEALSHGRYVMWSYAFPHCTQTSDSESDIQELQRLYALHQAGKLPLNRAGIEMVTDNFAPERIKENYLQRWEEIIVSGRSSRASAAMPGEKTQVAELSS